MKRLIFAIVFGCIVIVQTQAHAQDTSTLDGRWTLDRGQSQFPKEIGFTADWLSDAIAATEADSGPGGGARGGGRGGRRGGGGTAGREIGRASCRERV